MKTSFKTAIFALMMLASIQLSAQYSNASLSGAWYGKGFNPDAYLIFDGNGNVTELGAYGGVSNSNVGTYSVNGSGFLSGNLKLGDETFPLTGQFVTSDSIIIGAEISLLKIPDSASLSGTWSGSITNSDFETLNFTIDNQGSIVNPTSWSGHVFEKNGMVVGFFETDNTSNCWYRFQFQNCKYESNKITGTIASDCSDTKGQINLTRINSTEIKGISSIDSKVYPNPAKDFLYVDISQPALIEILNIHGSQLLKINASATKTKIDLSIFAPGVYFLRTESEKSNSSSKFIKQ